MIIFYRTNIDIAKLMKSNFMSLRATMSFSEGCSIFQNLQKIKRVLYKNKLF